jgi:hypothetical protein
MSLFTGTPATSYTTSSTETPKWMQDAIFSQIQSSANVANMPFQAYGGARIAGLTPYQEQAYKKTAEDVGSWIPSMNQAMTQTGALTSGMGASQAASPYIQQAAQANPLAAAQGYMQTGLESGGLQAASPYLQQAGQSAVGGIQDYMNPYTQNVTDQIARLGARNLSENLLPNVSDAFIKAGQFGGTRMGEFGSRALRDTQESILGQQSQALQQGYGQALGAAQQDASRQAQLASTAGGLGQAQQQAYLTAAQQSGSLTAQQAQQMANLGQMSGQLASTDINRQLSAQQQLGALTQASQAMNAQDRAALEASGSAYQSQQQREIDAARQQFAEEQAYPRQTLDWLSTQIRGMAPITPQTTTQTGTANTGLSPLSQLAAAGAAAAGLYKQFGT